MLSPTAGASGTTLVVPCHDEADRLDPAALARLPLAHRVGLLLVDDGSTDDTRRRLGEVIDRAPAGSVRVLSLPVNRGKGEAVRLGMLSALHGGAPVVGFLDADLSTPVEEAVRLASLLDDLDVDVVLGSRVKLLGRSIQRRPWRHYSGRVFATVASIVLALPVYDTQCGAKLFRSTEALHAALARPFRSRWSFDVELLQRLILGEPAVRGVPVHRIVEEPLRRWQDVPGSKLNLSSSLGATLAVLPLLAPTIRHRLSRRARSGRTADQSAPSAAL